MRAMSTVSGIWARVGVVLTLAAATTGCARQAPPPRADSSRQQLATLAYYNAALEQALLRKDAELAQAKNESQYVEKLRAIVAVNDELLERLEKAERALEEALASDATSEEDRFAFAKELDDIRVKRALDLQRDKALRESVQQLQVLIDTGALRVMMEGDHPQLVLPRPLDLEVRDPWAAR